MGHFKVSVDLPNLMKGVPVEVPPVGLINNGDSIVVESEKRPFENDDGEVVLPAGVKVEATSAPPKPAAEVTVVDVTTEGGEDE